MTLLLLKRPIVSLDLETTGPHPDQDRVVEIGLVKLYPDGKVTNWKSLINPDRPISAEMSEIHGILDRHVANKPRFGQLAPMLIQGLMDCDIIGYNVKFDIRFLLAEFARAGHPRHAGLLDGHIVDALQIFRKKHPRTLSDAYRIFCGKELEQAHSADIDAAAALEVLEAQLAQYEDLPRSPALLHDYCFEKNKNWVDADGKIIWKDGEAVLNFGAKHQGKKLQHVPRGYLEWIMGADFSPEVKKIVGDAMIGVYPEREK